MTMTNELGAGSLRPNERSVSSEEIDGEAILMNHDTGMYFNSTGSGGLIWRAITLGASLDQAVVALAAHYELAPDAVRADVTAFVAELHRHGLVVSGGAALADAPTLPGPARGPYAVPELGVHGDLADLLLLDPIHEVAEAGWPTANPPRDDERK